jgi:hypothetical protein
VHPSVGIWQIACDIWDTVHTRLTLTYHKTRRRLSLLCLHLVDADDVLCISYDSVGEIKKLDKFFLMKPGSIGDPDTYLGAKLKRVLFDNGDICWGLSASKYIRESINNVEGYLIEKSLPKLDEGEGTVATRLRFGTGRDPCT